MSGHDLIASATLAQLYIAQGHLRKADQTLNKVLESHPLDGSALHLRARLHIPSDAKLTLEIDDSAIELSWRAHGFEHPLHAVLITHQIGIVHPSTRVTSSACKTSQGAWTSSRPDLGGSAIACLGWVGSAGFTAIAVTGSVAWSSRDVES